jgi:phospholipase/carboxylesterase
MLHTLETGAARKDARLAAVMIHGRGRTPQEMAALGATLAVDGVCYCSPEAPGGSWYPGRFMEPLEANQPALGAALAGLESLIERLVLDGFSDDRVVLCGFSQGACLAADLLLRRPANYAAALLFTGGLIGPPGTIWRARARLPGVPVLLTGGDLDEWVPSARVRETAEVLAGLGAAVETVIYADRPHLVCEDEILRARALLNAQLSRLPELAR